MLGLDDRLEELEDEDELDRLRLWEVEDELDDEGDELDVVGVGMLGLDDDELVVWQPCRISATAAASAHR